MLQAKYNESTPNRPEGSRAIDAPIIPIDLRAYAMQLMEEHAWQKNQKNAITIFKSTEMTVVLVALHKDAEIRPGTLESSHQMTLQVLDGQIKFTTEQESLDINRNQVVMIHEHIPYTALATEETICLITMSA